MNILNPRLVEQQQLTPDRIELLENLHLAMAKHKQTPIEDIKDIPEYVSLIESIEYAMQRLWGFDEDSTYHTHWFTDPKCDCPIMDNSERQGVDMKIVNLSCQLHGDKLKKTE